MKTNDPWSHLPENVARKLREIQRRSRTLTFLESLARTATALILAMVIAMAVDLAIGWVNPLARYTVTSLALGAVAAFGILWFLPILRRRNLVKTAREVDETVPQLEERWSSVTEFAQSKDAPEVRGSETMIRQVASEADLASAGIDPEKIVSTRPALNAGRWLLGAAAAMLLMLAFNSSYARVLLQRFWAPGANVSLTEVHASPASTWVAKGEPLTLNVTLNGRIPKEAPRLFIRRGDSEKEIALTARSDKAQQYQHSIDEVSDSFEYRARAGDGQTEWQRITAVDRPEITAVKLSVTPPAYSQLPKEEKDALSNSVRVLQGSEVLVAFKSSQPLSRMIVELEEGKTAQLTAAEDQWYQYRVTPVESFTFTAVATNEFNLENKNKPSSRIVVFEDAAPTVKVLEPSDEVAVLPTEKVNVTFEAKDDLGLAKAELVITTTTADGKTSEQVLPVDLKDDEGKKQTRKSVELDPRALGLKHGDQLSYVVKVTDTKQNPTEAGAESQALASNSKAGESKPNDADANAKDDEQNQQANEGEQNQPAKEGDASEKEKEQTALVEKENPEGKQNSSTLAANAAAKKNDEQQQPNGARPPENEMSKRMLDAGQCTACKPRNIQIDEWAGTFEGEKRKKLEIAIAPVLAQLDEWLQKAEAKTESLQIPAASPQGLEASHAEPLSGAKGHLGDSEKAIADLKSRTNGTPYAFAGLQLHNIGGAHVTPAHRKLDEVTIAAAPANGNVEPINKATFHIGRAREMLADLTRTFENVKRDQKIADAMQKLAKMHQVFIEDTQALLGGSKGPINSYDRKIAEVNEEFVEKLKAMLEEKKKIMAELSKLLGEDPRLLRRFLAMQQMQAASIRDQMTLLAERQKQVQQQLATWNKTAETKRAALIVQFGQTFAASQGKLVQDAAALRENMETWLPLDVKPEQAEVAAALTDAEKIVKQMTELVRSEQAPASGEAVVKELRRLRETVSKLESIDSKDKPRMTAYIANRLTELDALIMAQVGQSVIQAALRDGNFAKAAEVTQNGITTETAALSDKLIATEKQVAELSDEIAEMAAVLNKMVKSDIMPPQATSVEALHKEDTAAAGERLDAVVPAFALAEDTFDELMRMIIAKLDEAPAPNAPGQPKQLEDLLAMLEDEMKAVESLGIPCRPMNVAVMSDWMKPGNNPGMGQGEAQAKAAQAQAQKAKAEAERMEKEARESAKKALAEAKNPPLPQQEEKMERAMSRAASWNKIASKLQKDLLQGRDSTPPEQYRSAIESYFKVLSETPAPTGK
jgi:hypothetical protein